MYTRFLFLLITYLLKELFIDSPSFFKGMQRYVFVLICQVLFEIFFFISPQLLSNNQSLFQCTLVSLFKGMQR